MQNFPYTHRIAVNAYLLKKDKFLLLQRNIEPYIWSPPGGMLKRDEDPISGLKREVKEETNYDIEIVAPVNTWFGYWRAKLLLSIDYLAYIIRGDFKISSEHKDFAWVSITDLQKGQPVKLDRSIGFKIEDFQNAIVLRDLLQTVK